MASRTLVIGYGNPSRNDDGVGWYVDDISFSNTEAT